MATNENTGLWHWNIVKLTAAGSVALYAGLLLFDGFDEASTRQAIRWSARLSVLLFCLAFGASALQFFWKNVFTFWLRMNRRYLGISFAVSHLIHLGWLVVLQANFHSVFERAATVSLLGGGAAYLFALLMLLTSFPRFAQYLSKQQWTVLHTVGGYWIWYIFVRSYVKRALTEVEYLPLVLLLAAVFVLRISRWLGQRKQQREPVRTNG